MRDIKTIIRTGARFVGPMLAVLVWALPPPEGPDQPGLAVSAIAVWMVVW